MAMPATISRGSPNRGTSRRIRPPWTTAREQPEARERERGRRGHPSPSCRRRKSESVPSSAANARIDRKPSRTSWPIPGRVIVSTSPRQLTTRAASRAAPPRGSDSGSFSQHQHPGQGRESRGHQEGEAEPPVRGDRQADEQASQERPEHEAQPEGHADQPHARARFSGGVTSAT